MAISAIKKVHVTKDPTDFTSIAVTPSDAAIGKRTENGAFAYRTTKNPLLDYFAQSGALRTRSEEDIYALFARALAFDELHALRALFYTRDIRGGQGERRTFRAIIKRLAFDYPAALARNIHLIPEYGRFDDLYALVGTPLERAALTLIADQWNADATAAQSGAYHDVSLLSKWLKSENASSPETKRLAAITRSFLGLTPKEYRQSLSAFRSILKIVETSMSSRAWDAIDYSTLPSLAHHKYRAAFSRHDPSGYQAYLDALKSDAPDTKVKINASTLFPYDLVRTYANYYRTSIHPDDTVEAQWKALPNYLSGDDSFLVMVDTSGSMFPNAICSSVGLGIYFADHARGPFKNHFITFTDTPRLVALPDSPDATLCDKVKKVLDSRYVGYSTNLEAAFDLVLSAAVKNHVPASDMPRAIVAISDMEIDEATPGHYGSSSAVSECTSFTNKMKKRFEEAGYTMPTLVYWNVEARQDTFHATANDNVRFVSGQSPAIFKALCEDVDSFNAVTMMMKVLDGERYIQVR